MPRTRYCERVDIDWNPVIHVLDELSDGTHSFLELSYIAPHYTREAFLESLVFLADRGLVKFLMGRDMLAIPQTEWSKLLREAFGMDVADPAVMVKTSLELTDKGEQILRLFNIGHPPLSVADNVR